MGGLQASRYLCPDLTGQPGRQCRLRGQMLAQVRPRRQIHDDRQRATLGDHIADPHDIRVGELGERGCFAQETGDDLRVAA
jgi:hypothetical protein